MEVETPEQLEAAEAKAFEASFAETSGVELTETPVESTETKTETPAPVEPVTDVKAEPEYHQLTKDQFDDLIKLKDMMSKLNRGFGELGNVHQLIKQMQAETPVGIDVSKDDFKEMVDAEFPEMAEMQAKALTRILSKLKLKGTGQQVDEQALSDRVEHGFTMKVLDEEHPDWRDLVGPDGTETPLRTWIKEQGPEFEKKVWASRNPILLTKTLKDFKEAQKKAADAAAAASTPQPKPENPKADERRDRMAAGVNPKGVPPTSTDGPKTEADAFAAGFRETRRALGLEK